jgi:syntaxin 1B/2/3
MNWRKSFHINHEIPSADMFLWTDTAGGRTPTTREEVHRVVDMMRLNNHTTLHTEVDITRSHTAQHHRRMVPMPGTMVLSQQWAGITMVSFNVKPQLLGMLTESIAGANVEMEPLAPNGSSFGRQQDPNAILNECKDIGLGIDKIENNLERLRSLQQRALDDPDSSAQSNTNMQLDSLTSETMTLYREFAGRIRSIKQRPDSGSPRNASQVKNIDRRLKTAIQQYQRLESDFRAKLRDQMARQYRIVNPNASQAEVESVVSDTSANQQVFSQALMNADRRGQSRQALNAVENRHAAIQKIEAQMIELADLFNQMEELVVQQEAAVTIIEQKGEEVVDNIQGGNEHLVKGVVSARARNRKKWWCLLICGMLNSPLIPLKAKRPADNSSHHHHHRRHHRRHLRQSHQPPQSQKAKPGRRSGDSRPYRQCACRGLGLDPKRQIYTAEYACGYLKKGDSRWKWNSRTPNMSIPVGRLLVCLLCVPLRCSCA